MERGLRNSVGNWKFSTCFYLYVSVRGFFFPLLGLKTKIQSSVLEPQMDVLREPSLCGERGGMLATNPPSQMFIF